MNFKDMLLPLSLALLSTWFIQYFFLNKYYADPAAESVQAGQRFTAPVAEQLQRPLMREVDFLDKHIPCQGATVSVDTLQNAQMDFSTCGAALTHYAYGHDISGQQEILSLLQVDDVTREGRGFIVALDQATPFMYQLVRDEIVDNQRHLVFQSSNSDCMIEKHFIVHQETYKIDLQLTITPRTTNATLRPRIIVPAPLLADPSVNDASYTKGLVVDASGGLQKIVLKDVAQEFWAQPSLFGAEDKYFVAALVSDEQQFAQRGYFKQDGARASFILEGPVVQESTTWNMSFYYGPKEVTALNAVDRRLEGTLDYGWLSPVSKALMWFLKLIYKYVHNYGWAIIIVTLLLKIVLIPMSSRAEKSARKSEDLSKKMRYIEQKYKDDKERLAFEKQELMRKHGIGDALGCLPMLAQIPLFFALNRALSGSLELYKAPFIGWIHDLSACDPYYIVPLFIGSGILLQSSSNKDARQRLMMSLLALFITGVTANLAVGLAIFIAVNSWASIGQTYLQKRFAR